MVVDGRLWKKEKLKGTLEILLISMSECKIHFFFFVNVDLLILFLFFNTLNTKL